MSTILVTDQNDNDITDWPFTEIDLSTAWTASAIYAASNSSTAACQYQLELAFDTNTTNLWGKTLDVCVEIGGAQFCDSIVIPTAPPNGTFASLNVCTKPFSTQPQGVS
jgi:hypothetical protein